MQMKPQYWLPIESKNNILEALGKPNAVGANTNNTMNQATITFIKKFNKRIQLFTDINMEKIYKTHNT